ncbi:hypothetical protein DUD43_00770 [Alcaligenes faecalis]|nr:hypothetical protein DUD43_00770 [Alcaligenes faecalis]
MSWSWSLGLSLSLVLLLPLSLSRPLPLWRHLLLRLVFPVKHQRLAQMITYSFNRIRMWMRVRKALYIQPLLGRNPHMDQPALLVKP